MERQKFLTRNPKAHHPTGWRERAISMRKDGLRVWEIAVLLNVDKSSVSRATKHLPKQRIVPDGYKFSNKDVARIRKLYLMGIPQKDIATLYGATRATISRYIHGKSRTSGDISKSAEKKQLVIPPPQ